MVGLTWSWRYQGLMGKSFFKMLCILGFFWPKAHIRITQQSPSPLADSPTSPATMPERDDQLSHSPAARVERSMNPVGDRDPSESPAPSPPPAHVKGKGKRQAPPPLPPKKLKKPKQKKPPLKLAYEKTNEEHDKSIQEELDRQIFKAPKPLVEKPIYRVKFHRFMWKMEEERRKNQMMFPSH
jgi:hypothetical protein